MLKRAMDIALAAAGLVVLSPIMAAVALAVRISMGPPVIFHHPRPGKGGRVFVLHKFRTMVAADGLAPQASEDERVTRLGAFLRRTSLDELPSIWNVLVGEMSLVGPRPLLVEYLTLYSPAQARRHEVRPGLTGLAQVKGRNAMSWQERLSLDTWYVDHQSFLLDLKIMAMTVAAVVQRRGITTDEGKLMPKFGSSAGSNAGSPQ